MMESKLLVASPCLCPLHISRSDAPIVPRCCWLGQCEWVHNPESAVGDSSGDHPEVVRQYSTCLILHDAAGRSGAERVQCNCLSEGVVINKTPSLYAHRTNQGVVQYLVPTDANVRIVRHLANVNGVPTRHRKVLSRFASD